MVITFHRVRDYFVHLEGISEGTIRNIVRNIEKNLRCRARLVYVHVPMPIEVH